MPRQLGDFSSAGADQGWITNYRTGDFVTFHLNPNSITEKKGVHLVEDAIPGGSHTLLRWASSKANVITFSLDLDAEISLRKRGRTMINFAAGDTVDDTKRYSIDAEIEFFESFQYPVDPAILGRSAEPDKILLGFGRRYSDVLCVVEDVSVNCKEFTPELYTSKAKVDLTLKRYTFDTVFAKGIYDYDGSVR